MDKTENKIVYSKNEKIVRIICYVGIALSVVIGILLFPLGKVGGGIAVLCTSAVSLFLLNSFFVKKYKAWFAENKNKRIIYACLYAFILILSMFTAAIISYFTSFDEYEMATKAMEHTQNAVKTAHPNIHGELTTDLFDFFESGDGYYYAFEIDYKLKETGGAILKRSEVKYVKVNKYTSATSFVDFLEFERARSYID